MLMILYSHLLIPLAPSLGHQVIGRTRASTGIIVALSSRDLSPCCHLIETVSLPPSAFLPDDLHGGTASDSPPAGQIVAIERYLQGAEGAGEQCCLARRDLGIVADAKGCKLPAWFSAYLRPHLARREPIG